MSRVTMSLVWLRSGNPAVTFVGERQRVRGGPPPPDVALLLSRSRARISFGSVCPTDSSNGVELAAHVGAGVSAF